MPVLLITGGAGLLGQWLARLASQDPDWVVYSTYGKTTPPPDVRAFARQCDLLNQQAVHTLFAELRPQVVIHCAAVTQRPAEIAPITENIAHACLDNPGNGQASPVRLLHLSTDALLDGNHAPYPDNASPAPLYPYGHAKATAEELVKCLCPTAVIARTSLIFSHQPLDHQTGWLVNGLRQGQTVTLFEDEYRCPIWVQNLASALLELAKSPYQGMLNLCGAERISRWEYGNAVLELLESQGLADPAWRANLRASTIAASGMVRPPDLTLDISTAQALLSTKILPIRQVLHNLKTSTAKS